ncbi:RagB/SusD family nutrient uptake outer membrane protein [Sphingobacterium sp. GVS05A]|uniref:RagB/SusD family nutrient uptake outer membrane protein n=1 Tax=Sphingobacterium sp. GVS05A TaxID=2862679 RepID=UPI001CC0F18D|nr:RagB/SusD family nutrient uptake outer membrane protein [Sphingobacterium sp. GVS05A]
MKKLLIAVVMLGLLSSCEKFLNVNPTDKAYEEDLLTDRSGFNAALAGVYETLNTDTLYGREMKYGFMESLVGSYNVTNSAHKYYRSFRYEYNYDEPKKVIDNIWARFYQCINQTNIILGNVGRIENDPYYNLVRGEAIGLRAFCHFQLLKLFGPAVSSEGIEAKAIPYRTAVVYSATKFSSAAEVIALLEKDLSEARDLLEKDPIRSNARNANLNQFAYEPYNSLIDYRGIRMNYYAIVALQAMVAQWKGDLVNAGKYAEEVITELKTTQSIRMALSSENGSVGNTRMPMENIFALFSSRLGAKVSTVFAQADATTTSSTSPFLFPNYTWLRTNLYNSSVHGSLNDARLAGWFVQPNTSYPWKLSKYLFDQTRLPSDMNYRPLYESKVIGLHTIYMIAAENYASINPAKAMEYLNLVRNTRNITTDLALSADMTTQKIRDLIFDEMRKENIGEGYLFTEYKRLFRPIDRATPVQPKNEIFRLPIPADELLYNPQN